MLVFRWVLISFVTLSCGFAYSKVIDRIVAIVNGEIITLSDLRDYRRNLETGGLIDSSLLSFTDPKELIKDQKKLLDHLINERIADSEVKRKGLQVTIERVEQEIRSIAQKNGISRSQLVETLSQRGVPLSTYQDFVKTSLERQTLIEREVASKIRISDEDVASYYLTQRGLSDTQIYEYTIAHIFFSPNKRGLAESRKLAEKVLSELKAGQNFERLVSRYSDDARSNDGGLLGKFKAGEMQKEMEAGVRNLNIGDISEIVKTSAGFHILRVLDKKRVVDPRLEKQKEEIRNTLYEQAFRDQFRIWLRRQRDDAFLRINDV